jgi:hypothetical protein
MGHSRVFLLERVVMMLLTAERPADLESYFRKLREPKAKKRAALIKKLFAVT